MKTQALVNAAVGAPFELIDIELEEPEPNEVLVKMTSAGLCHTDFVIQSGAIPSAFPSIQGHEGAGVIEKVGSAVGDAFKAGDRVLLSFASCTECDACRSSLPTGCASWVEHNFGRRRNKEVQDKAVATSIATGEEIKGSFFGQSSFARHALVQASSCVKISQDVDLETFATFAPLGCGLQTGFGAVINVLRPQPEDSLVITGLGAVGFAALFAASYLKLKTVIVVDLVPSRLELAKELSAHHALDGSNPDLVEEIKRLTNGGADYSIEATGVVPVLRKAWECLRFGGTVVSLGNPGPGFKAPFDIHDMVNTGKAWRGCVEGNSNPPEFIPFLINLYKEGKFPIDRLSKLYPVEEWDKAVEAMKSGEVIKPIVTF
ncbi:NAD(P)-dependent alcohol dehydrogenase [Sporobolomyces salmoneus]|uniref:NAD(P)-dependent alcohol dehydrogenase n=1 Tax=Sporobolomyces salmoneus TaxID=183962 RepID=UPI0031704229